MTATVTIPCPICRADITLRVNSTKDSETATIDSSALYAHISTHMNPNGGGEAVAA